MAQDFRKNYSFFVTNERELQQAFIANKQVDCQRLTCFEVNLKLRVTCQDN